MSLCCCLNDGCGVLCCVNDGGGKRMSCICRYFRKVGLVWKSEMAGKRQARWDFMVEVGN